MGVATPERCVVGPVESVDGELHRRLQELLRACERQEPVETVRGMLDGLVLVHDAPAGLIAWSQNFLRIYRGKIAAESLMRSISEIQEAIQRWSEGERVDPVALRRMTEAIHRHASTMYETYPDHPILDLVDSILLQIGVVCLLSASRL